MTFSRQDITVANGSSLDLISRCYIIWADTYIWHETSNHAITLRPKHFFHDETLCDKLKLWLLFSFSFEET